MTLNPDQFNKAGYKKPNPDDYNYDYDYQSDLKRWQKHEAAGTDYVDTEVEQARAESVRQAKEEFKPVAEQRRSKAKAQNETLKIVSKAMSAMGMPKAKPLYRKPRKRWK